MYQWAQDDNSMYVVYDVDTMMVLRTFDNKRDAIIFRDWKNN